MLSRLDYADPLQAQSSPSPVYRCHDEEPHQPRETRVGVGGSAGKGSTGAQQWPEDLLLPGDRTPVIGGLCPGRGWLEDVGAMVASPGPSAPDALGRVYDRHDTVHVLQLPQVPKPRAPLIPGDCRRPPAQGRDRTTTNRRQEDDEDSARFGDPPLGRSDGWHTPIGTTERRR